ncbi:MAG: hypothetical protein ACKV1O_22745 [Saprospiraceae bacterium]
MMKFEKIDTLLKPFNRFIHSESTAGIFLIVCSMAALSGCATPFSLTEINNVQKVEFEPLYIQNDLELYDLRIDIIRQAYDESTSDTTSETRNMPYHPAGFNLGNGLFYDLNGNLSLRIDKLLEINPEANFRLEKAYAGQEGRSEIYSRVNDTFSTETLRSGRIYNKLSISRFEDSISVSKSSRYRYSVKKDDSTMVYTIKNRVIDKIHKKKENYYQNHRRRVEEFVMTGNEIVLNQKYKIFLDQSKSVLKILRIGKKSDTVLYEIIKDNEMLLVYNSSYFGKRIALDDRKLTLYVNNSHGHEYKLIE